MSFEWPSGNESDRILWLKDASQIITWSEQALEDKKYLWEDGFEWLELSVLINMGDNPHSSADRLKEMMKLSRGSARAAQ